jgi:hypothetical protein
VHQSPDNPSQSCRCRTARGTTGGTATAGTVSYISAQLAAALNDLIDQRPKQRAQLEEAKRGAEQKLHHLVQAVEAGAGAASVFAAIEQREAEIHGLNGQLTVSPLETKSLGEISDL